MGDGTSSKLQWYYKYLFIYIVSFLTNLIQYILFAFMLAKQYETNSFLLFEDDVEFDSDFMHKFTPLCINQQFCAQISQRRR